MENEKQNANPDIEATEKPTETSSQPAGPGLAEEAIKALREKIVGVVRTCFDPEIPVNIYDLGLIYEINIAPSSEVDVKMTLTSPGCPSIFSLPGEVEDKIRRLGEVKDVRVQVVWEPTWDPSKMSEAAKLQLGMM
jgi:FeS assembly SUF system protein